MTVSAGELRHRVGFYMRPATDDGKGNVQGDFPDAPEFTVAAAMRPKFGSETPAAGGLAATSMVNITVRASDNTRRIATDWKARDERKAVDYAIRSIIDPDMNTPRAGAFIELLCEAGVAP